MKPRTFALTFAVILILQSHAIFAQTQDPEALYFIQITDTHLGQDLTRISKILNKIKELPHKIDFTVYTGDLFKSKLSEDELNTRFDLLIDLNMPAYIIAGNVEFLYDQYDKFIKNKIGKINYLKEHKGITLCFLSSFEKTKNSEKEVLIWLENMLSSRRDKPVLLFHHEPFMRHSYAKDSLKAWKNLLKKYNFLGIFSGHTHKDALLWHDNVPEFVAPCVTKYKGRQASFRLYECKNGRISYSSFYINDE